MKTELQNAVIKSVVALIFEAELMQAQADTHFDGERKQYYLTKAEAYKEAYSLIVQQLVGYISLNDFEEYESAEREKADEFAYQEYREIQETNKELDLWIRRGA